MKKYSNSVMTKELSDKSMKIILTHYLMVTKVQKVTYFPKISVSIIWRRYSFSFHFLKYRYPLCGEDIASSENSQANALY